MTPMTPRTGHRSPHMTLADRSVFLTSRLSTGLHPQDLAQMLDDGYARITAWPTGSIPAYEGNPQHHFFVLLAGRIDVTHHHADGRTQILDVITPGKVCGAVTACLPTPRWPADIHVAEAARALLIDPAALLTDEAATRAPGDLARLRLLQNLTRILAGRARHLHTRIGVITAPSLRGKISAYLLQQPRGRDGKIQLTVTRQEMADILVASRASMIREMSRMVSDGLITTRGRQIVLHDLAALHDAAGH
ncbi:cAMP-binding domain of CRP or a regulatory subunit of cAMP-dependent protein kinases [Austwickia chelonae]|nr:Crp/Fnr family transcriptional regulator [Austwickia chelonae]SEW34506.1 cAMP-binding domain of CRP or a regulatory subunit of cAMP-dependent protein kinases [Austwickia chelonae]